MLRELWRAGESLGPHGRSRLARDGQQGHLDGRHHCPFEVGVYVYVLGLLWGHGRRCHHHPGSLHLGGHVHTLRGRGVVRVLQGEQRLELLLLEQTSDRLLLRRWRRRRGRLGLRRRNQPRRVRQHRGLCGQQGRPGLFPSRPVTALSPLVAHSTTQGRASSPSAPP